MAPEYGGPSAGLTTSLDTGRMSWDFFSPTTDKHQQHNFWKSLRAGDGAPQIVTSDEVDDAIMGQSNSAPRDLGKNKRPLSAPSPSHISNHSDTESTPSLHNSNYNAMRHRPAVLRRLSSAVRRQKANTPLRITVAKRRSVLDKFDPRRDSALTETSGPPSIPEITIEGAPVEERDGTNTDTAQLHALIDEETQTIINTEPSPNPDPTTNPSIDLRVELKEEEKTESERVRSLYEVSNDAASVAPTDYKNNEIDRFGFIVPAVPGRDSADSKQTMPSIPEEQHATTTSTRLRAPGVLRKVSRRSLRHTPSVISRARSTTSMRSVRSFSQLHIHHDKRVIDKAGSMLSDSPGLIQVPDCPEKVRTQLQLKKKEWAREDKWRRMGTKASLSTNGGGMQFKFSTKDPKVVSRTWKGIPDRWRASAWFSFLASSAAKDKNAPSESELVEFFYTSQDIAAPDDVQIDMDVPRTINHHIRFGQRYMGGQRLLFRVLHATSLYIPDIGYVQGMAAIAATLLCYYAEDQSFIMMVRLFRYRGLSELYAPGFTGLITCLETFEKEYLARKPKIAAKLEELGIASMTYGTRWYLTLFNYSLPFVCQLRVWDVFMLLDEGFGCLHATGAALFDASREILEGADFEAAMKAVTGFVAVEDQEKLMATVHAEYKLHKKAFEG